MPGEDGLALVGAVGVGPVAQLRAVVVLGLAAGEIASQVHAEPVP